MNSGHKRWPGYLNLLLTGASCLAARLGQCGVLWLALALPAFAQVPPRPGTAPRPAVEMDLETAHLSRVATAVRITTPISLDGRLDDPAWELAIPAADFIQRLPNPGSPVVDPTEVRLLYDDDNLYIGVICFDSDAASIAVNDLQKDFDYRNSDTIALGIDSLHDLRTGFIFRTNPGGAKADTQATDGVFNNNWDGVWDVKTTRNPEGWIAEFMIPFKTLRFSRAASQVWGFTVNRKVLRTNEDSNWSPIPIRYTMARVNAYGTLRGLENISQGRNLKVKPFVTSGLTQIRPTVDAAGKFKTKGDFDGGADFKYSLTPSLTLDATLRTDFAQVEVDQQQVNLTRFNLFFPEKRDFFLENSGIFTFGAGNNLVPFFSRRIGLSSSGAPTPIVGGARVTGKVSRYDIGFLSMNTEDVGKPGETGYIPSNNYTVGRVKRNLLTNSWVGALATSRDSSVAGDYNRVYGADAHFLFHQKLEFDSHVLKSQTPALSGHDQSRQLQAAWRDDELVLVGGYSEIQTNFNPEAGFIRRKNNTHYNGEFSWSPLFENNKVLRNLTFGTNLDYYESRTTGQIETRTQNLDLGANFKDNSSITLSAIQTLDRLIAPFDIHGDISISPGDYNYLGYSLTGLTNPGEKLSGNGTVEWGEFWNGRRASFTGNLSWKANVHLKVEPNYSRNQVRLPNGRFTTNLVGARFLYSFNPRTFLNAFIQYNADTHQVSSNIRFNIIHHPLSDLFLVYNDLRDTANGRVMQRAITLKLTNLFNF